MSFHIVTTCVSNFKYISSSYFSLDLTTYLVKMRATVAEQEEATVAELGEASSLLFQDNDRSSKQANL